MMQRSLMLSLSLSLLWSLSALPAWAQHGPHHPETSPSPAPESSPEPQPAEPASDQDHSGHDPAPTATPESSLEEAKPQDHSGHDMSSHANPVTYRLMERARTLGSGTSLLPQTSPMRMWSFETGDWLWMLHGDIVAGYNHQGGPRGTNTWAGENWAMGMLTGHLGPGILDLRAMGSLEGLTLPPGGTPELFQTGETYLGQPLRDKQHPHDLLMELAARYTIRPTEDLSFFAYAGLAGEPALGPSAFMHRPSAADNHWAPLSHHLQDATHISYGVGTLGARWRMLQLEASLFNGREPDENRFNIDFGPLDSWSTRLSWIPNDNWVAQISYGQLKDPEPLEPGSIYRTTASVTHVLPLELPFGPGLLSSSFIWGMNQEFHDEPTILHGFGLESQYDWDQQRNHVYGRLEVVDKNGLALTGVDDHSLHKIMALTLGGIRDIDSFEQFDLGIGADASIYLADSDVRKVYGDVPYGFRVYLRLRPPAMTHNMASMQPASPDASPTPTDSHEHQHLM